MFYIARDVDTMIQSQVSTLLVYLNNDLDTLFNFVVANFIQFPQNCSMSLETVSRNGSLFSIWWITAT